MSEQFVVLMLLWAVWVTIRLIMLGRKYNKLHEIVRMNTDTLLAMAKNNDRKVMGQVRRMQDHGEH